MFQPCCHSVVATASRYGEINGRYVSFARYNVDCMIVSRSVKLEAMC